MLNNSFHRSRFSSERGQIIFCPISHQTLNWMNFKIPKLTLMSAFSKNPKRFFILCIFRLLNANCSWKFHYITNIANILSINFTTSEKKIINLCYNLHLDCNVFHKKTSALKKNLNNIKMLRYFESRTHFEEICDSRNINSEFVRFNICRTKF